MHHRTSNPGVAHIGPNAVLQMAAALDVAIGANACAELFAAAGRSDWLQRPPTHRLPEDEVIALHRMVRTRLPAVLAGHVARDAGARTADYLLAHRIPRPVRALLPRLPSSWAMRMLLALIRRHAWTFCGSGACAVRAGRPAHIRIAACPLCRGLRSGDAECGYFAATFERLMRELVDPRARVRETACGARGDPECAFRIDC